MGGRQDLSTKPDLCDHHIDRKVRSKKETRLATVGGAFVEMTSDYRIVISDWKLEFMSSLC